MANHPLLIVGPAPVHGMDRLESAFDTVRLIGKQDAIVPAMVRDIQAVALLAGRHLDAEFMRQFPSLKIIASFGVGYDHIDIAWAGQHGVVVTNTPDVLDEEVADTAIGLLISTVRELPQAMAYLKAGHWQHSPYPLTRATLRDRTVGLIGMGRIGQCIARRLEAFRVPVVYHARRPNPGVRYRYYEDLVTMAGEVDTLIVVVPGGPQTNRLVDRDVLDALGSRGILINIARGTVVDQQALIAAPVEKRIYAAGLDVYEEEPEVPDALIRLDNVVLLPHVGSASEYTRDRMQKLVVDNLIAWASGNAPLTPVAETRAPSAAQSA